MADVPVQGIAGPRRGAPRAEPETQIRLRPPSWRDTRLIVGVLIVLASVALGARVVAAADSTVPAYAADSTLVAGRPLRLENLRVVRVHLGSSVAAYLAPGTALPPRATVLRTVRNGELVPLSAVGPGGAATTRPVSIPIEGVLPAQLRPGTWADVWSSAREPAAGETGYRSPVLLARAAEVATVTPISTGLSLSQGASVQVQLDEAELRAVLDALANGARLALIPAPGASTSG